MDIIKNCREIMDIVRNSVADFKMETLDKLSADEQLMVDMFSARTVGDIVSALVEFAHNAKNALLESSELEKSIEQRFARLGKSIGRSVAFDVAQERDNFELELLENGHNPRHSFSLASNSIHKGINEQANKLEFAMIETLQSQNNIQKLEKILNK